MTGTLHQRRRALLPLVLVLGLVLAWLPISGAWGEAREIHEDVCSPPYDSDFDDIDGSAHADNIRCMADKGLTRGVGDGSTYDPRGEVTRAQMASFLARFIEHYIGAELDGGDEQRFDDVSGDSDHAANINKLAAIEVVGGTSDGSRYAPRNHVTRAQMASMIRRTLSWLDDEDARNASAPEDADDRHFADTDGTHADNVDALAAVGIVQGFDDDTYGPQRDVKRDQMASFVMRSYDYAVEAELRDGPADETDDPAAEDVRITSPTTSSPAFPVAPGDEVDVTFVTDSAGTYELQFRDPHPEGGPIPVEGFPIGGPADGPGDWTTFSSNTAGVVTGAGSHTVSVRLPTSEADQGVRDLRLTFVPEDTSAAAVEVVEEAALIVAAHVVINLTQEVWHFTLQDAVDAAGDDDVLLAIGEFEETVEVSEVDGLILNGHEETTLAGSLVIEEVDGIVVHGFTITDYDTFSPLGLGIVGEDIGIVVTDATNVTLTELTLNGENDGRSGVAIAVEGATGTVTDSTMTRNHTGVELGDGAAGFVVGEGNRFVDNVRGVNVEVERGWVLDSEFVANNVGVRVAADFVRVLRNELDGNHTLGVRILAEGAIVRDNAFGAPGSEADGHLCFPSNNYAASEFLPPSNTFAGEVEVRGTGPTCIAPPEPEEPEDEE